MPSLPPAIELARSSFGSGPLVVGLHDLGRSRQVMSHALDPLGDRFEVLVPDLRGHGDSPTPEGPWSIDDFASDVARLIAAEGGGAILVGVGLGGATSLALALGHPGLLSGLIVSGVSARAEDQDGQERWLRVARALRERQGFEGVALSAEAMSTRPDLRGALTQVDPPVLILAGEADRAAPPDLQREIGIWIRASRYHVVPDAGHDLSLERPHELVTAVEEMATFAHQAVAA